MITFIIIGLDSISTALFKREFRTQFIQDVRPLRLLKESMVGEAYTLRYMPARVDLNQFAIFRDPAHPQRKAIEECSPGHVPVIGSRRDPRAAPAASLDIPAFHQHPSAPTNLTRHHDIAINVPIGCGDAPVFPGGIVAGDNDGVIIIPAHLADEIADETTDPTAYEDFVTERVRSGQSIRDLYPMTDETNQTAFAAWRKANGR